MQFFLKTIISFSIALSPFSAFAVDERGRALNPESIKVEKSDIDSLFTLLMAKIGVEQEALFDANWEPIDSVSNFSDGPVRYVKEIIEKTDKNRPQFLVMQIQMDSEKMTIDAFVGEKQIGSNKVLDSKVLASTKLSANGHANTTLQLFSAQLKEAMKKYLDDDLAKASTISDGELHGIIQAVVAISIISAGIVALVYAWKIRSRSYGDSQFAAILLVAVLLGLPIVAAEVTEVASDGIYNLIKWSSHSDTH